MNKVTSSIDDFSLYSSGGTIRDGSFNLVCYESRFDTNRGFEPPRMKKS